MCKQILIRLVVCGAIPFLAGVLGLAAGPTRAGERVALIIGNSKYPGRLALTNPANDAKAFAEALRKISPKFKIIDKYDIKSEEVQPLLDVFEKETNKAEIGLFYYAVTPAGQ